MCTNITCGIDLPERKCPRCGADLMRDGYDIPFEVFLGFKGDKVPDIDLNFSGDLSAPRRTNTSRSSSAAGRCSRPVPSALMADKTAYGYVRKWL